MRKKEIIIVLKSMKDRSERKAGGPFGKNDLHSREAEALGAAIAVMEDIYGES